MLVSGCDVTDEPAVQNNDTRDMEEENGYEDIPEVNLDIVIEPYMYEPLRGRSDNQESIESESESDFDEGDANDEAADPPPADLSW